MPRFFFRQATRTVLVVLALGAVALVSAVSAGAAVTPAGALTIAQAMASSANVTGASFQTTTAGTPNGISTTLLGGFPTDGSGYGILTTGNVSAVPVPASFASTDNGGPAVRGDTDRDVTVLKTDISVPTGANCLTFDFKFLSEEYPFYVDSVYNDAFIAELDSSTWTTSGSTISAPNNFAFDSSNNVVSINSTGLGGMSAAAGAGTAFDGVVVLGGNGGGGATGLLHASTQVTAGAHSVYFSIFDQGDNIYDSAVFLDNLAVGFVPSPAVNCKPGATPVNFKLSLTPATATNPTGTSHTVTATLTDAAGTPISGATLSFTVTGANSPTGTATTDASGVATFTYAGTTVGVDSIGACYDADSSPPCEAVASATKTWTNAPPTVGAGGPYSGNEGSAISIAGTASDPEGDTLTTGWTYTPVTADAGATCSFGNAALLSTTVTCTDDGTFKLTLTASDGINPAVTSDATLTVANVNPVVSISAPAADSLYAIGATVPLTASFTDAGKNDSHTCTVNWDDGGGPVTGTVSETVGTGTGTCSSSKSFTAAGVYSIVVTVTDDNGGVGTAHVMVIVYDPDAGFVTGGGWINSPAGAYAADPTLVGKANFGFVSKYKKGATPPTGETEFQFQAGSFNFHSDAYQWLVVAGCKAQYKGTGTVNGVAGYGFLLTATDGNICTVTTPDKFRIKVWKLSDSSVVYDNNMGGSTDIDSGNPQIIAGGQIVIHK